MDRISLQDAIDQLRAIRKLPKRPEICDPWLMVLWENVAYMADDQKRRDAFAMLRRTIGVSPKAIQSAPQSKLMGVTQHGILAGQFAHKLKQCAQIARDEFPRGLNSILRLSLPDARKALMKFPGIGRPGAEKILLIGHAHRILALESNGLRVLVRLGFTTEQKSYAATYRLAQQAATAEAKNDFAWLISAHELLRRHGQEICRRTQPECGRCPLARQCPYPRRQF